MDIRTLNDLNEFCQWAERSGLPCDTPIDAMPNWGRGFRLIALVQRVLGPHDKQVSAGASYMERNYGKNSGYHIIRRATGTATDPD